MDYLKKLDNEMNNIDIVLKKLKKKDIKQSSIIIDNSNQYLLYSLIEINPLNKKINNLIKNELLTNTLTTYNKILDKTYEVINELNLEVKKSIISIINSSLLKEENISCIEKLYNNKTKELMEINNKFLKTINQNYDIFLYKLTFDIDKKDINEYNRYVSITNKYKSVLLKDLSNIILDKKNDSKKIFKYSFIPLIKEVRKAKAKSLKEKEQIVIECASKLYKEKVKITINKYNLETYNYISERLNYCEGKIDQVTKFKNKNNSHKHLLKLKDYLFSFNNTLFSKNEKILLDMGDLLKINSNKIEKEFKKYSDNLSSIYNINYNFEAKFYEYKEVNQNILINGTTYEKINNIVFKIEKDIEKEFNITTVSLFKDMTEYLNSLIYKILLVKYKLADYSLEITTEMLEEIFNNKLDN